MKTPANEQECVEQLAQALEIVTAVAEYYRTGESYNPSRWEVLAETRARIDYMAKRIKASSKDLSNIANSPN